MTIFFNLSQASEMKKLVFLFTLAFFFTSGAICQTEIDPYGVIEQGYSINTLPHKYQKDPSVALFAIENFGLSELNYVSSSLLGNRDFILELWSSYDDEKLLEFIPDSMLNNDGFFENLIYNAPSESMPIEAYKLTSDEFKRISLVPLQLLDFIGLYRFSKEVLPYYSCNAPVLLSLMSNYGEIKEQLLPSKKLDICDSLKQNKEFMRELFAEAGSENFRYASDELKSDREFVLSQVKNNVSYLNEVNPQLLSDREIITRAIESTGSALRYAGEELKKDKILVQRAIESYPLAFQFASPDLRNDKELLKLAIDRDVSAIQYAGPSLLNDPEIMTFELLSEALNDNRADEFILKILPFYSCNESALLLFGSNKPQYLLFCMSCAICESLLNDENFLIKFFEKLPENDQTRDDLLKQLDSKILSNPKLFDVNHLDKYPDNFKYADKSLQHNRDFVLKHVKTNPRIIYLAPRIFQEDKEILSAALVQDGLALQLGTKTLKSDIEIVRLAVDNNSFALKYASEDIKNNFELVKQAVNQDGNTLEHVSNNLRKNKEIISTAFSNRIESVLFIDSKLLNDRTFMLELASKNPYTLFFLKDDFQNDLDFQKLGASIFNLTSEDANNIVSNYSLASGKIGIKPNTSYANSSKLSGKILQYKIDINGKPYLNGKALNTSMDYDSRRELENTLKSGDQVIIHSVIIHAIYDGDKKHQTQLVPSPLTLTVK